MTHRNPPIANQDTLSGKDLACFHERGWVRIRRAFATADAAQMRQAIWTDLEGRYGARADDPGSWRNTWHGLKPLGQTLLFRRIGSPRLVRALDQVLGRGSWRLPRGWHMFLVTPPTPVMAAWTVPSSGWHWDASPCPRSGVNAFVFYDAVLPRGGGTLLVEGSHRLIARFCRKHRRELDGMDFRAIKARFANDHPWIRRLGGHAQERSIRGLELLLRHHDDEGTAMRVVEMTGAPGDVILWHSWMYHVRPAPHQGSPRMMGNVAIPMVQPCGLHARAVQE